MIILSLLFIILFDSCKKIEEYQVYAIKYSNGWKIQAKNWVIGAKPSDSVDVCDMFWLIRSHDGKKVAN